MMTSVAVDSPSLKTGAYGQDLAVKFHVWEDSNYTTPWPAEQAIAFTHLSSESAMLETTMQFGREIAIFISMALNTTPKSDYPFWTLSLLLGASLLTQYAGMPKLGEVAHGGLAPWQKRKATEFLSDNLASKIRLHQVAKECELSVSHFARSFKETFGVSAHRWLVQERLRHAQHLLLKTSNPLIDIALQSGFSDQAAFTRIFTRDFGASPGRWRKHHRDSSPTIEPGAVDTLRYPTD